MTKNKWLSQEGLKLIACLTMLIDHIGAEVIPMISLRIIGRLAFPIYCFLLAEGMAHTRNVKKYGLRLAVMALVSEIPFDLLFCGGVNWMHQNVMVTLLLGFFMTLWIRRTEQGRLIPVLVFAVAAELLRVDYGGYGIMMIALFVMTREGKDRLVMQAVMLLAICWLMGGAGWRVGNFHIPIQSCAVAAMVPIGLYSGRKATDSRLAQRGFYLFYPVHMIVLLLIKMM